MDHYVQETIGASINENIKILETKKYDLSLNNEKYELTMNLNESFIEFILYQKNIISSYCYQEKFDLPTLNKYLFTFFKKLKEVFIFYDKVKDKKKVKLIQQNNNRIDLNMRNIINYDEKVETNLELKKNKLLKDDLIEILLNEVNELKKIINSKKEQNNDDLNNNIKRYIDNKINELNKENKRILNANKNEEGIIISEIKNDYGIKINKLKNERQFNSYYSSSLPCYCCCYNPCYNIERCIPKYRPRLHYDYSTLSSTYKPKYEKIKQENNIKQPRNSEQNNKNNEKIEINGPPKKLEQEKKKENQTEPNYEQKKVNK